MIQIIFLFFGILVMIYLIIIYESANNENKNILSVPNIYPIDIQSINPIKKKILWKNNKNRKQKRKT
jgi:hypothetical protein